jgi:hypothetical protein
MSKQEAMEQINFRTPAALKKRLRIALAQLGRSHHGEIAAACRTALEREVNRLEGLVARRRAKGGRNG